MEQQFIMPLTRSASASLTAVSDGSSPECVTPPPMPRSVQAPGAPVKYRGELARVWSLARKWRAERDRAHAQLDTSDTHSASDELSRVWALARKWRSERDQAHQQLDVANAQIQASC